MEVLHLVGLIPLLLMAGHGPWLPWEIPWGNNFAELERSFPAAVDRTHGSVIITLPRQSLGELVMRTRVIGEAGRVSFAIGSLCLRRGPREDRCLWTKVRNRLPLALKQAGFTGPESERCARRWTRGKTEVLEVPGLETVLLGPISRKTTETTVELLLSRCNQY
jgi:hypothetical protein